MKKIISMILVAVMLTTLVGCGGNDTQNSPSAEGEQLEDFSIILDWYPNAIHSFLYVAQEKGYFEEEGLSLHINFPSNPNDGIALPAVKKADVGMYYLQDAITTAVEEEVPIVSIGAVTQSMLGVVVSLEKNHINEPKDLKGKKIGYSGSPLSEASINAMLANANLKPKDCEFINVGFDVMTAITSEQVDACTSCLVNHEVPNLEEEGFDVSYFSPADYGVPQSYELIFLANEEEVEANPEKYKAFLRACQKGFAFMKEHPDEALQILMDNQNEENFPLTKSVEMKSMETILPIMETENAPFLHQDVSVWQENADWLYEQGILKEKADVSHMCQNLLEEDNEK